jgi:hypothetical protein
MINLENVIKAARKIDYFGLLGKEYILVDFLKSYNDLQEKACSDPEAWREKCREKQAAGVKYAWRDKLGNWRMEEQLVFCFDKENYREVVETPKPPFPDLGGIQNRIREALNIEGKHGNWNFDPYMHGMYNGMEFALSIAEDREPQYKDAPARWLYKCKGIEETPKPTIPHIAERKLGLAQREAGTNEVWQIKYPPAGNWVDIADGTEPHWCPQHEYRVKPKTEKRYMAMVKTAEARRVIAVSSRDEETKEQFRERVIYSRWTLLGDIVERETEL